MTANQTSPARHRAHPNHTRTLTRIAGFALWGALIAAVVAVVVGYRDSLALLLVLTLLLIGGGLALASRLLVDGIRLDAAVDRLLNRVRGQ